MSRRAAPAAIRLLPLLAALALGACRRAAPEREAQIDLRALFPLTAAGQGESVIDLGTPRARPHLGEGWSDDDVLPGGETVVWTIARRTALEFELADVAPRRIVLRCGAVGGPPARIVPVIARLNGLPIGMLRVHAALEDQVIVLPPRAQRVGRNRLELEHPLVPAFANAGRKVGAGREVAYDSLTIETPGKAPEVRVADDGSGIALSPGARVDFYLRAPPAALLELGLAPLEGETERALRVTVARDDEPERTLLDVDGSGETAVRVDLGGEARRIVRLSFRAGAQHSVRLVRALIRGTPARAVRPRGASDSPAADGAHGSAVAGGAGATLPNILLYVIDTLRADHLGCFGYALPTSPHIDALAADGILWTNVVAQASWTTPATASILTGLDPLAHQATRVGLRINPAVQTLAERLAAAGYRTGAFVTNLNVAGHLGFERGFQDFTYLPEEFSRPTLHVLSDELNRAVVPWLEQHDPRPFFLYVHASDPHAPYTPPVELAEQFAHGAALPFPVIEDGVSRFRSAPKPSARDDLAGLVALYDGEVRFTDESFGQLLAQLDRLGLSGGTVTVLAADHGEEFHDHGGFEHGHTLYDELLHVPLIIRLPSRRGGGQRSSRLVRQIDIAPTLLDLAGIGGADSLPGESLVDGGAGPVVTSDNPDAPIEVLSQSSLGPELAAITSDSWKVIEVTSHGSDDFRVYDREMDRRESTDLAGAHPVLVGYARQRLTEWRSSRPRPKHGAPVAPAPTIDPATRDKLRALGYLGTTPESGEGGE